MESLSSPTDAGHATLISPDHPAFPWDRLRGPIPIPILFYELGDLKLLGKQGLAISGSRSAHPQALEYAREIAQLAADNGYNIVSGNAQGIDSAAHARALEVGGTTTAVLAEGIASARSFLGSDGPGSALIVSQFEPDAPWTSFNAMARNSTIASLADAVVVVAAGSSGGSWEQAQLCMKNHVPLGIPAFGKEIAEANLILIGRQGVTSLDPASPKQVLELLNEPGNETAPQTAMF